MSSQNTPQQQFSARLREAIYRRRLTQEEFAEKMETRQSTVSQWIRGRSSPRPKTLDRIGQVLGLNPAWLLSGSGDYLPAEDDSERLSAPAYQQTQIMACHKLLCGLIESQIRIGAGSNSLTARRAKEILPIAKSWAGPLGLIHGFPERKY